jgi:hypothetical protein
VIAIFVRAQCLVRSCLGQATAQRASTGRRRRSSSATSRSVSVVVLCVPVDGHLTLCVCCRPVGSGGDLPDPRHHYFEGDESIDEL